MKRTLKSLYVVAVIVCFGLFLWWVINENSKLGRLSEKIGFTNGEHRKFYPDGTLQSVSTYKNDKLHGEGIEYYPNGKLKYEDFWVNGNLVWRRTYDTNGILVQTFGEKPAASTN